MSKTLFVYLIITLNIYNISGEFTCQFCPSENCPKQEEFHQDCNDYLRTANFTYCNHDGFCKPTEICCYDHCFKSYNCMDNGIKQSLIKSSNTTASIKEMPSTVNSVSSLDKPMILPLLENECPKEGDFSNINCESYKKIVPLTQCNNDEFCESNEKCCFDFCYEQFTCMIEGFKPNLNQSIASLVGLSNLQPNYNNIYNNSGALPSTTPPPFVPLVPSSYCPKKEDFLLSCDVYMKNVSYNYCNRDDHCENNEICCYDHCYKAFNCMDKGLKHQMLSFVDQSLLTPNKTHNNNLRPVNSSHPPYTTVKPVMEVTTMKINAFTPLLPSENCPKKLDFPQNCDVYKKNISYTYCNRDDHCESNEICCYDYCHKAFNCMDQEFKPNIFISTPNIVKPIKPASTPILKPILKEPNKIHNNNLKPVNSSHPPYTTVKPVMEVTTLKITAFTPLLPSENCPKKIDFPQNCDVYKKNISYTYCNRDDHCKSNKICCYDYCHKAFNCMDKEFKPKKFISIPNIVKPIKPTSSPIVKPILKKPKVEITTKKITPAFSSPKDCPNGNDFPQDCEAYKKNVSYFYCNQDNQCESNEICCFDYCYLRFNCIDKGYVSGLSATEINKDNDKDVEILDLSIHKEPQYSDKSVSVCPMEYYIMPEDRDCLDEMRDKKQCSSKNDCMASEECCFNSCSLLPYNGTCTSA